MSLRKLKKLHDINFKRKTGLKKWVFYLFSKILRAALIKKKSKGGAPNKLSSQDMLMMTLEYFRTNLTFEQVGDI